MSVNLYQTGVSGLLAAQQQLATTGHNIANVNTDGYNRQRAEQGTSIGIPSGGNIIGSGTYVQDITRIYNQYSHKEQLLSQSKLGNAKSIELNLNQLNDVMSTSSKAIDGSLKKFYQAVNGIVDNPGDLGLRSIALNQAKILSNDFKSLNDNFTQLEKSTNGEIEQIAGKISKISLEIAKLNEKILQSQGGKVTGKSNDLLDKRDQLVGELGKYTSVNTIQDDNGVMTVMVGNGATLVAGITPLTVGVIAGDPDASKTSLQLIGPNSSVALNGARLGGELAAKFEYRDVHLPKASAEINRLAMAISSTINNVQAQGLDVNAKQGRNIFTDINSPSLQQARVLTPSSNTGTLSANVSITDVSLVPSDNFKIRYDGTNYVMTNTTNGSSSTLVASSPGVYPTAFGFTFNAVSGAPATGDSFDIRPTENSAALMAVTLTDSKGIAASSAIETKANSNNVSDGAVSIANVSNPEVARSFTKGVNNSLTVDVYQSAANTFTYRIYNAATPPPAAVLSTGTFASGSEALVNMPPAPAAAAFQVKIGGLPVGQGALAREKFTISDAFGAGNSTNIRELALTQEKKTIEGGKQSFNQSLATSSADVGGKAASAKLVGSTAQALYTQAYNRNQSVSGVNLDEEAANMIKFQQAYQASSRIISVANTIFDTLLSAVR